MVYGRNRSMYRRKARRGARTLSTRRIFNNKGAKAQAKQIYALRKSVNRLARANRPEVKVVRSDPDMRTVGWKQMQSGSPNTIPFYDFRFNVPQSGTGDNQRVGNVIRLYPSRIFLNAQYTEFFNTYPTMNVEMIGGQLRIIAVQALTASNSTATLNDIMRANYYDNQPASLAGNFMMTMPFKNGITSRYRILYDKRFNINKDKPMFTKRITINPAIKTMQWEDGQTYPKGNIYVFVLAGGFYARRIESGEEYVWDYTAADVHWQNELVYTDA